VQLVLASIDLFGGEISAESGGPNTCLGLNGREHEGRSATVFCTATYDSHRRRAA
jgi:hypothetical protein